MDIDIDDNGDGTFSVYYTVKDAGEYTLSIKFGGNPVPDGVYNFTVSFTLERYILAILTLLSKITNNNKNKRNEKKQTEFLCCIRSASILFVVTHDIEWTTYMQGIFFLRVIFYFSFSAQTEG